MIDLCQECVQARWADLPRPGASDGVVYLLCFTQSDAHLNGPLLRKKRWMLVDDLHMLFTMTRQSWCE